MEKKRTYEKPEVQKLGLLRQLTKMSGWQFGQGQWNH
jgi:hypothetical protein